MKKMFFKIIPLLTALCILLSAAGCGLKPQEETQSAAVNAGDLVQTLLGCVKFDTPLSDAGDVAALFFQNLPEHALVSMYSGSGYFADELVWITLAQESDMDQALDSVDAHIAQVREQFLSYIPEELDKIDNAQIWTQGVHIIVCITNDYQNAGAIMADPSTATPLPSTEAPSTEPPTEATTEAPTEAPTEAHTEAPTEAPTDALTEPPTEAPTEAPTEPPKQLNEQGYPAIISETMELRRAGAAYITGNTAYERYVYCAEPAQYYASVVSNAARQLEGISDVYAMVIPLAVGIVFPDNLVPVYQEKEEYEDQHARMKQIFSMMDDSVIRVDSYENLMRHRDEYLYFRTDWHWNGPGAYYAYETFCRVRGFQPYTMEQRRVSEFDGYLGALYQQTCDKDPALVDTPDTVYAYHPYSENAYMYYTDAQGNRRSWSIISDVSNSSADAKYYTFAASDQPFAEFYNPDVTDGSVAIVVKESFGNVLMPLLVDHYSTVYEIDYRYWEGDLVEFAKEVGADDVLFTNNLSMICSNYLIGLMDRIIP